MSYEQPYPQQPSIPADRSPGGGVARRLRAPWPVTVAAGLLALLFALALIRMAVQLVLNVKWVVTEDGHMLAPYLAAVGVILTALALGLAVKVWQGRTWAWVTLLVLLGLTAVISSFFAVVLIEEGSSAPYSLVVPVISLLLLLLLTVPRRSRAYFQGRLVRQAHGGSRPY